MKRSVCAGAILAAALLVLLSCSKRPEPVPEEAALMDALQELQSGIDSKISYADFGARLAEAGKKYDALKRAKKTNSCFLNAANKAYASYTVSRKAWKLMDEAKTEKRRLDMDTTLSFSLGFASVSLAKARGCFEGD